MAKGQKRKMKASTMKKVVVRLSPATMMEFGVDNDIFDDIFMEAATRAIEDMKKKKYGSIQPIIECWDKKAPKRRCMLNAYWVLVNASAFSKAELLREKYQTQTDVDLSKQPVKGYVNH